MSIVEKSKTTGSLQTRNHAKHKNKMELFERGPTLTIYANNSSSDVLQGSEYTSILLHNITKSYTTL